MKQIFPSTITGPSFAEGGSVLDHNFGAGEPYTLGVEEEYMLLDGETLDLVQHVEAVLAATEGHELEQRVNPELMQSVLEIATPVCSSPAEVDHELRKLRAYVTGLASEEGMRVGSAGTHPFSLFERQRITARDRYRHLVDQLQYVARRELIFGLHIHVAVDDAEKAVKVVNGLLAHLSSLLALSASSPFWRGEPTGLASSRQMVFAAFPRSGPPPRFRDYADYAEVVGQLEKTGCIADYTHIWWDIRLHPRFGTVEIRVCDAVTRVEDAVALAAFCQALVKLYCERYAVGRRDPLVPPDPDHREQVARRPLRARGAGDGPRARDAQPRAGRAARAADAEGDRATRARARLRPRARGHPRDPRAGQRLRPPAPDLEREPRHRRGRPRDRGRDRGGGRSGLTAASVVLSVADGDARGPAVTRALGARPAERGARSPVADGWRAERKPGPTVAAEP